jgi:hypothetical protein
VRPVVVHVPPGHASPDLADRLSSCEQDLTTWVHDRLRAVLEGG